MVMAMVTDEETGITGEMKKKAERNKTTLSALPTEACPLKKGSVSRKEWGEGSLRREPIRSESVALKGRRWRPWLIRKRLVFGD